MSSRTRFISFPVSSGLCDPSTDIDTPPSETEVLEAVRKLILWAGDDPEREGLVETPKRVAKAYKEFFSGYHEDPYEILNKTFNLKSDKV